MPLKFLPKCAMPSCEQCFERPRKAARFLLLAAIPMTPVAPVVVAPIAVTPIMAAVPIPATPAMPVPVHLLRGSGCPCVYRVNWPRNWGCLGGDTKQSADCGCANENVFHRFSPQVVDALLRRKHMAAYR